MSVLILCACREEIVHNLDEGQANEIISHLSERAIDAKKVEEGGGAWAIAVDSGRALEALRQLKQSRLLRLPPDGAGEIGASLLSSKEDQRLRYERTLSHEIENTIGSLDGVLQARVHLNLPEVDPILGQPTKKDFRSSASVLVVIDRELHVDARDLAQLVSGASGIPADQVRVLIDQQAAPPVLSADESAIGLSSAPQSWLLSAAVIFGLCGMLSLAWYALSAWRPG